MLARSFCLTSMIVLVLCARASAGERKLPIFAQSGGATMQQAPHSACEMNESKEWKQSQACGTNDLGAWIGGEYRCWDYYDSISKSCKRTCTWTGKCDEH